MTRMEEKVPQGEWVTAHLARFRSLEHYEACCAGKDNPIWTHINRGDRWIPNLEYESAPYEFNFGFNKPELRKKT